jgi:hypothetical protein
LVRTGERLRKSLREAALPRMRKVCGWYGRALKEKFVG